MLKKRNSAVVCCFVVAVFYFAQGVGNAAVKADKKETGSMKIEKTKADLSAESMDVFVYDDHGKRDPFIASTSEMKESAGQDAVDGIDVEGIIWDEKKPVAVINDKVIGVGDSVGGAIVVEIRQNEVIFDIDGTRITKRLLSGDSQ